MIGDSSSDLLTEYVTLLREFGLPPEDVRELHADEDAPTGASLRKFVAQRVDDGSREALFSRLVETLTQSRRGISATASYWNYAPEVHLDEVFEPYGCSVTFRDAVHGGDGASVEIELEDAGGSIHTMRFEYPDTPLDDDNLPALLDAVETELLASTDLSFALLSGIDRRWRVVLLESDRLAELRRRHGDRIEFAGLPLLCEDQPSAFASGETPAVYPQAIEIGADATDSSGASPADATDRAVDPADLLADGDVAVSGADAAAEPTADPGAVLEASPDELIAAGTAEPEGSSDAGVEASDQELRQVFGDLSDVSLEPTATDDTGRSLRPDDPPVLELGTGAGADGSGSVDGDTDGSTAAEAGETGEEPAAIDGLFEELERKAITGDDGAAGGGGGTAVVGGVASAGTPTVSPDNSGHDGPSEDPTLEELLSDADALAEGASADTGDASTGVDDATAADREDAETDVDGGDADDTDSPGEFEWLSDTELAERE